MQCYKLNSLQIACISAEGFQDELVFVFHSEGNVYRSSHRRSSIKKGVFKNFAKFTEKQLCLVPFFNKVETLTEVFSYEFREILKDTFFKEHLRTNSSDYMFESKYCTQEVIIQQNNLGST